MGLFSEENICHIIRDLFVAGSENVAIGLLWLIGYMVNYKDVQDKCRECILQVDIICYKFELSSRRQTLKSVCPPPVLV